MSSRRARVHGRSPTGLCPTHLPLRTSVLFFFSLPFITFSRLLYSNFPYGLTYLSLSILFLTSSAGSRCLCLISSIRLHQFHVILFLLVGGLSDANLTRWPRSPIICSRVPKRLAFLPLRSKHVCPVIRELSGCKSHLSERRNWAFNGRVRSSCRESNSAFAMEGVGTIVRRMSPRKSQKEFATLIRAVTSPNDAISRAWGQSFAVIRIYPKSCV